MGLEGKRNKDFLSKFLLKLALGDEKGYYKNTYRKTDKNSKSHRVLKRNFNSVKNRQLHALHNRFGEQQDERPQ